MAENEKKQIPLRLSAKLDAEIAAWAEDDFRSVNGQIEFLLTECVRQHRRSGSGNAIPRELKEHIDIELGDTKEPGGGKGGVRL